MHSQMALFPSRRRMLVYGALLLAGGVTAGHGALIERHWTEVTTRRLRLNLGPDGPSRLRVALLTDFHYDPLMEGDYMERVVAETNAMRPDLILLLGDFVSQHAEPAKELLPILNKLQAPLGVRAVLGNHDFWSGARPISRQLENNGIDLLRNQVVRLPVHDGELVLAGFDSVWAGHPDQRILGKLNTGEQALLLHHEPDYIEVLRPDWRDRVSLQVSGHTHGGQICAPGGIVLQTPSHGQRFTRGHYQVSPNTQLYVSRGIGTVEIPVRLFCRPEIPILELTNSARLPA